MSFAGWLRAVRTARRPDVSQKDLATAAEELDSDAPEGERARFSQAAVSEWERGVRLPDLRQLTLIAIVLDCTREERAAGDAAWKSEQLRGLPLHDPTPSEATP